MNEAFAALLAWIARPFGLVGHWLTPKVPRPQEFEVLQRWRTILGYGCVGVTLAAFQDSPDYGQALLSFAEAPVLKAAIAMPCFMLAVIVLTMAAPTGRRMATVWSGGKSLLLVLMVTAVPVGFFWLGLRLIQRPDTPTWLRAAFIVVSLPLVVGTIAALYFGVRHSFLAGDIHPWMPGIVGAAIGLVSMGVGIVELASSAEGLERTLAWSGLGGGLATIGLSVYECVRLHQATILVNSVAATAPRTGMTDTRGWIVYLAVPAMLLVIAPTVRSVPAAPTGAAANSAVAGTAMETVATSRLSEVPPAPAIGPLSVAEISATSTAESGEDAAGRSVSYDSSNLLDGDPATAWRTAGDATGESIVVDFGAVRHVSELSILPGYVKVDPVSGVDRFPENRRPLSVTWTADDGTSVVQSLRDEPDAQSVPADLTTRFLTLTIDSTSVHGGRDFTAVSEIAVEGY